MKLTICLVVLLSCPTFAFGKSSDEIKQLGWNPKNFSILKKWYSNLIHKNPEKLLVLTDCDNTVWAGDIGDSVFLTAVKYNYVTWANAPVFLEYPFKKKTTSTPFDYYEFLYSINPVIAYNYAGQAFSGLTIAKTYEIFKLASTQDDFPKPYKEMKNILGSLAKNGVVVGYVSASPIFMLAPMIEKMELDVPLWAIDGIDIYVKDPNNGSREVLLSNLVNSIGLKSWSDVVKYLGHLQITQHASEIISARKGKSVGGTSIAYRYVTIWNSSHKDKKLTIDKMRLAGVFGDNFGPFSDLPGAIPDETGNDQGMLRSLPIIGNGMLIVDIYRAVYDKDFLDLDKYQGNFKRFASLMQQLKRISYPIAITQIAVYKGKNIGFAPMPPPPFFLEHNT